jgi:hypothetical protein
MQVRLCRAAAARHGCTSLHAEAAALPQEPLMARTQGDKLAWPRAHSLLDIATHRCCCCFNSKLLLATGR